MLTTIGVSEIEESWLDESRLFVLDHWATTEVDTLASEDTTPETTTFCWGFTFVTDDIMLTLGIEVALLDTDRVSVAVEVWPRGSVT